ncbi:unnamed protein product [marine sediment metagenome]|uniref:Uncharacterized protein n=1 Tax=marine sediment metagenome TaxID=412755 RepID=X1Q186_9ZZZZ
MATSVKKPDSPGDLPVLPAAPPDLKKKRGGIISPGYDTSTDTHKVDSLGVS